MEAEDSCSFVPLIGGGPGGERRNASWKNPLLHDHKLGKFISIQKNMFSFLFARLFIGMVRINHGANTQTTHTQLLWDVKMEV